MNVEVVVKLTDLFGDTLEIPYTELPRLVTALEARHGAYAKEWELSFDDNGDVFVYSDVQENSPLLFYKTDLPDLIKLLKGV